MHVTRVLILGGYGFFGSRLVKRLALQPGLDLVIAGRSAAKGAELAASLGPGSASQISSAVLDVDSPGLAQALAALAPQVVVHTAGPFQGQDYRVARACIDAGAHYIDLADSREFVTGIAALDSEAQAAGVTVVSGASSVPALSSAVSDALAKGMVAVSGIEIGITPGNRTDRGLSTVRGILSYCGKPISVAGRDAEVGWLKVWAHRYAEPVGERLLSPCDVPDLALLPHRYPGEPAVRFVAGLELRFLHRGMNVLAWMAHRGWVQSWVPHAALLKRVSELFLGWGSDAGAMHVSVQGRDSAGRMKARNWELIATHGDGPYVPTLAALALVQRLVHGMPVPAGAMPCVGLLGEQEILEQAKGLAIRTTRSETVSLFHQVLGDAYERLDTTVQAFHDLQGRSVLQGEVHIQTPQTAIGRLLAFLLGSPQHATDGPLRFELHSSPDQETWVRHFPGRTMRSTMRVVDGELVENLGPARVTFTLSEAQGKLVMRLRALRFFGIPCPGWLLPRVEAVEHGEESRLCFDILASVPWVGQVAAYRGYLQLPTAVGQP